jgi:Fibronectin type III domain
MTSVRSVRIFSTAGNQFLLCVFALIFMPLQAVLGQTPVLSASVEGYTAVGFEEILPDTRRVPITVKRNDSALHSEASGEGGSYSTDCVTPCIYPPAFTNTYAGGFASADPGVLRVFAADLVEALPELNAPNVPVTPNNHTVYSNIAVSAGFTVYLTVGSTTQPVGTPVQVPFHYAAEMIAQYDLNYPPYSVHPLSAYVSFTFPGFGPQNFSTTNCHIGFCGFSSTSLPNGNSLYSVRSDEFFVPAKVGDVLPISAAISISGSPRIVNGNNSNGNGNVIGNWADGRNTAGIWVGTLPNGLTITSSDGHDYTIDPTAHGAPVAPAQVAADATAGDARAIVSFSAPLGTGASAITDYKVTSSPGGITATGSTSPIIVLGLTNGTAYTFVVTSRNAAGLSTDSAPSNSVTPNASLAPAAPSAPVIGVAEEGDANAIVNFTAPSNDGGSMITGYTVTSSPGGITATGATSPITVTGLTNGTEYTFTVTANNALGMSAASAASNGVTPVAAAAPTPTPSPTTPTPSATTPTSNGTSGGGGGAMSLAFLLMLLGAHGWRDHANKRRRTA